MMVLPGKNMVASIDILQRILKAISNLDYRFMSDSFNQGRRRFLGNAAMTIAAAKLQMKEIVDAPSKSYPDDADTIDLKTNCGFGTLNQINAGVLDVGYADAG